VARSRTRGLWITDAATMALPADARQLLSQHWRRAGELEHASVVAFHDLAARLRSVGAGNDLIQRARHAAEQEAEHARQCFALASRYAGCAVTAGRLRRPFRLPRRREAAIAALAVEALRDGVLNEGYAAWLAAAQLDQARDEHVRATLTRIAADEAEHAQLSRDVLEWCLIHGSAATRVAVNDAYASLPAQLIGPRLPDQLGVPQRQMLAEHGLVDVDSDGAGYRHVLESIAA
jgi:hypothetical protein